MALDLARQENADARRALENEQKLKEEAEGLAAALARDVGVLQREKTVLEEQVTSEAQVTFLLDVRSRFSDAIWCSAWVALQRQLSEVWGQL